MPGIHIGDGAIIGTNSVVAKDIPPYSIAVGNPCQVIRKRFDDELIELLLKLRWWDKSIEEIESLMPILSCGDLEKVKAAIKQEQSDACISFAEREQARPKVKAELKARL